MLNPLPGSVEVEAYFRLLASLDVIEEALIEIGRSLPLEARAAVAARMRDIVAQGTDGVYAASRGEVADRIARSLITPDKDP